MPTTYPTDPVTGELLPVTDPHVYHDDPVFQDWIGGILADFFAGLMEADLLSSHPVAATHGAADTSPTAATVHPWAVAPTRGVLAHQCPTASPREA